MAERRLIRSLQPCSSITAVEIEVSGLRLLRHVRVAPHTFDQRIAEIVENEGIIAKLPIPALICVTDGCQKRTTDGAVTEERPHCVECSRERGVDQIHTFK